MRVILFSEKRLQARHGSACIEAWVNKMYFEGGPRLLILILERLRQD